MKIECAQIQHLTQIANIHRHSEAGALSHFSSGFIRDYYANVLSCMDCRLLVGKMDDNVIGFVLLSLGDSCTHKNLLMNRLFSLIWRLMRSPSDFFKLLRLLFMSSGSEERNFMPELVYIVVDEAFRGEGRGRSLFAAGVDFLRKSPVTAFRLMVETQNKPARDMYISFGGQVHETTHSFGENVDVIHFDLR